MNILLFFAVLIVGVLAAIAVYFQVLVYKHKQKQKQQAKQLEENAKKARESMVIIARAMLQRQVSFTEASMRIAVLSEAAAISAEQRTAFSVFFQLAQATAHIPILDAWKALPKEDKKRFDKEREDLEAKYRDFLVPAAEQLVKELAVA